MQEQETKTVNKDDMIQILIRKTGCSEEDARTQVSLAGTRGIVIGGTRYIPT